MAPVTRSVTKKKAGVQSAKKHQKGQNHKASKQNTTSVKPTKRGTTKAKARNKPIPKGQKTNRKRKDINKPLQPIVKNAPFPLLDFPPEVADLIYQHMIRDGQVNILRTCSAVHDAASRFLHSDGVFRIKNYNQHHNWTMRNLSQLAASVQNVEIHLRMTSFSHPHATLEAYGNEIYDLAEVFHHIARRSIPRKNCTIAFWGVKWHRTDFQCFRLMMSDIKTDFETVVIYAVSEAGCSRPRGRALHTKRSLLPHIRSASEHIVEPHLGPGTWRRDVERGHYVEFHPRQYWAQAAAKQG